MQSLATTVQSQSHLATSVAFLEHNDPTVVDAVRQPTADMTNQPLHVLGLFLSSGYHATVDVPHLVAATTQYTQVVDHGSVGMGPWLLPALERNLAEAGLDLSQPRTGVVLVAAGSSNAEAREETAELAAAWRYVRGISVQPAYASGQGPTVPEALEALALEGCQRSAVSMLMLAPGVLTDRVTESARAAGVPVAAPLASAPEVAQQIVELVTTTK